MDNVFLQCTHILTLEPGVDQSGYLGYIRSLCETLSSMVQNCAAVQLNFDLRFKTLMLMEVIFVCMNGDTPYTLSLRADCLCTFKTMQKTRT